MEQKKTRIVPRSLIVTFVCSLLTCALLMIGVTNAWFTSSVSSKGNTITASDLSIVATGYAEGTYCGSSSAGYSAPLGLGYQEDGVSFNADGTLSEPIITTSLLPRDANESLKYAATGTGDRPNVVYAYIKVKNKSTYNVFSTLTFDVPSNQLLGNALSYCVQDLGSGNLNQCYQNSMPAASDFLYRVNDTTLPLNKAVLGVQLYPNQVEIFRVDIALFNGPDQNEYQNQQLTFDAKVNATQDTASAIAAAGYANNEAALVAALENGGTVTLTDDITLSSAITISNSASINLNGHSLNATAGIAMTGTATVVNINGPGTIHGYSSITGGTCNVNNGASITA